jgi:hypothetical protein
MQVFAAFVELLAIFGGSTTITCPIQVKKHWHFVCR